MRIILNNKTMAFTDIYNAETMNNPAMVEELMKAVTSGGDLTGVDLTGTDTSGSALKMESLDPQIKVLTNTDKFLTLIKKMPKQKVKNTVHQYNQLKDYGTQGTGIFNAEGATPSFTDSVYKRESAYMRFMGIGGEVTHVATLMDLNGVNDLVANEAKNKTQFLLRELNKKIVTANSSIIPAEFDGIFKQHYVGLTADTMDIGTGLSAYYSGESVIDARGKALNDTMIQKATFSVMTEGYGVVNQIVANSKVWLNYANKIEALGMKRINVGMPMSATTGATMGFKVNTVQTQSGAADVVEDIFFDVKGVKTSASVATGTAPTAPVADTSNPATAVASLSSDMVAGDYYYGVTAVNSGGESTLTLLTVSGSPVTVASGGGVDLKFTAGSGGVAATGYKIYRSEVGGAFGNFYEIFSVSTTGLTTGYDGAAAGLVRDRDYVVANTSSAFVTDMSTDVFSMLELMPMMRQDLAYIAPSYRFMILYYACTALFAPKKLVRIVNIGSDLT